MTIAGQARGPVFAERRVRARGPGIRANPECCPRSSPPVPRLPTWWSFLSRSSRPTDQQTDAMADYIELVNQAMVQIASKGEPIHEFPRPMLSPTPPRRHERDSSPQRRRAARRGGQADALGRCVNLCSFQKAWGAHADPVFAIMLIASVLFLGITLRTQAKQRAFGYITSAITIIAAIS